MPASQPSAPTPPTSYRPIKIGPTWQTDENGKWILPERSLGWHILGWTATWLQNHKTRGPWKYTAEQARFLLWWYAVDERGEFIYRNGVLQRLKGWGKDPFAATLALVEAVGPCRFDHWATEEDSARLGVPVGQPVGKPHPAGWVQVAAVSQDQTKNTMRVFPSLYTDRFKKAYDIDPGQLVIHCNGATNHIESVTSSPVTLEGGRATFVIANETHHWKPGNTGLDMWDVLERNAAKADSDFGAARVLCITNAYMPGEESVAEGQRDAMEKVWAGEQRDFGLLYDSLEAPPEAPLSPEAAPLVIAGDGTRDNPGIRGDSTWLNVESIVASIVDPNNPPSRSRRFWYNQITSAEDKWVQKYEWEALARDKARPLVEGESIALFFDGSKSDDATGLLGCRIEDGAVFTLGVWQRPAHAPKTWTVPRQDVDAIVNQTHSKYKVVGFFGDPGSGEDDSGERYWDMLLDNWSLKYGDSYVVQATKTGHRRHAVMWDMRSPVNQKQFTESCERTRADIVYRQFQCDGNPVLGRHVINAVERPDDYGVSITKEHRESKKKIDLAVCMVGVRMVRRIVLGSAEWQKLVNKPTGTGRVRVL